MSRRRLSPRQKTLLTRAYRELLFWKDHERDFGYGFEAEKLACDAADKGLVRCNPSDWLEFEIYSPSLRHLVSRDYKRLEDLGLVKRVDGYGGGITTFLKFTRAGRKLAEKLSAEAATTK